MQHSRMAYGVGKALRQAFVCRLLTKFQAGPPKASHLCTLPNDLRTIMSWRLVQLIAMQRHDDGQIGRLGDQVFWM